MRSADVAASRKRYTESRKGKEERKVSNIVPEAAVDDDDFERLRLKIERLM